jgi:hypothetical protein
MAIVKISSDIERPLSDKAIRLFQAHDRAVISPESNASSGVQSNSVDLVLL